MAVLTIDHVYKSFRQVTAVHDLSLELEEGIIFGLLGPNGAGKTTTIRMIMDIIMPDRGKILILGQSPAPKVLDQVGYLPEERGLYRKMKVGELLSFMAELKGIKPAQSKSKINDWLERFDLIDRIDKKVEELSRGMQQKIQFISTVLHEPKLIILDEPFTGLDPVNTDLLIDVMHEFKANGVTIIFSTHLMDQVEKLCDSICLINEGRSVLAGNIADIKKKFSKNTLKLEFQGDASFLTDPALVKKFNYNDSYFEIEPAAGTSVQKILQAAAKEVEITRFERLEPSLHEIFIETVTQKERN